MDYTINKGDCMWNIVKAQYGDDVKTNADILRAVNRLAEINNIEDPNLIYTGNTLYIPSYSSIFTENPTDEAEEASLEPENKDEEKAASTSMYEDFSNWIKDGYDKLTGNKRDEVEMFDYVIIDTPPTMSSIVSVVLSITNVVLIPFEPDQYAVLGLRRVAKACNTFKEKNNPNLKVIAIPTKVNNRANIHKEIINIAIRPKLNAQGVIVTNSFISSSTKSTAAVGYERVPIVLSVQKNKFQKEYEILKNEILLNIYGEKENGQQ